ncbi:MAG: type II secretion system GspH family protein [Betaproteobacteria bacterium]|jgi:general secretion pathway protein G|nr:type II secretion system GspH family protein [Betaproteobacteria bacterium]
MKKWYAGFTLIEMIVVLSIVALLLTIALPRYFGAVDKSKDVVLQENLKVLRATLDKYHADKGHYPGQLEELVEGKYLRAIPIDPITESAQTWVLIHSYEEEGIVDVKSGARGLMQDGQNYDAL